MTTHLLHRSAFWQARVDAAAGRRIRDLGQAEALAACTPAILEMMIGARNAKEWTAMRAAFDGMARVDLSEPVRAIDLQDILARKGRAQAAVVDILIAATAAEYDLTILHFDREVELLVEATGGKHEWVVPGV